MSASQTAPVPSKAQSAAQPTFTPLAKPDHYTLHGAGISVTYLPTGAGGLAHLTYQDHHRTLNFSGDQIRKVDVPDLGTVVSVTLSITVDAGSTTFSVLIPAVNLPDHTGASAVIHTEGITTTHRFSLAPQFNLGQTESYTVVAMSGNASLVIIPL
jgi:hypothetical protein